MLFLCGEGKRPVAAIDPIPGSYCVTYKQGGADELTFEVPKSDPVYLKIREESVISDDSNRYLVKERDSHGETGEFFCQLDLDELKSRFYRAYRLSLIPIWRAVPADGRGADAGGKGMSSRPHL